MIRLMSAPIPVAPACPPPLPPTPGGEIRRAVTCERLRILSIAYYISGALGAASISILLIHFCLFTAFSFIPEASFHQSPPAQHHGQQAAGEHSPQSGVSDAFPVIIFRIVAGILGMIILCGWTLGGLTIYAGRCIARRKKRTFVLIMAGINCLWIPFGTLLGIVTFLALGAEDAKLEYPG